METSDLQSFHDFLSDRIDSGDTLLPEECLLAWREQHPAPSELTASVKRLQGSIKDLIAGRTEDFDSVNKDIRLRHGWQG